MLTLPLFPYIYDQQYDLFCTGKGSLQATHLYYPDVLTTEDILMCWYVHSLPILYKMICERQISFSHSCSNCWQISFTFEPVEQSLQPYQAPYITKPLPFTVAKSTVFSYKKTFWALSFYSILYKMYTILINHLLKLTSVLSACKKLRLVQSTTMICKQICKSILVGEQETVSTIFSEVRHWSKLN